MFLLTISWELYIFLMLDFELEQYASLIVSKDGDMLPPLIEVGVSCYISLKKWRNRHYFSRFNKKMSNFCKK